MPTMGKHNGISYSSMMKVRTNRYLMKMVN